MFKKKRSKDTYLFYCPLFTLYLKKIIGKLLQCCYHVFLNFEQALYTVYGYAW